MTGASLLASWSTLRWLSCSRRYPLLRQLLLASEQEGFQVRTQDRSIIRISRIQPIVIDDDRLIFQPHLPGIARDLAINALTERPRKWWTIQSGQLSLQLHAVHHSRHDVVPLARRSRTLAQA